MKFKSSTQKFLTIFSYIRGIAIYPKNEDAKKSPVKQ